VECGVGVAYYTGYQVVAARAGIITTTS